MTIIRAKPWEIARQLSEKYEIEVIAARDGMQINLDKYQN